jgi:NADP-dependent aldehyde dehydrogenase
MTERLLVTGADGNMGRLLRSRLSRPGRILRLLDLTEVDADGDAEVFTGSVTDPELMARACAGADAVLHLGGISRENSWADILAVNIDGTRTLLDAAAKSGVPRVILASSNHAVGFRRIGESGPDGVPADSSTRPDTYYGVSKAATEALGSLFHSRFGMDVRGLGTWLSPDDAARLVEACLSAPSPGFKVIWGVSANTRRVYSLREAEELGYRPQDDAERFAAEIIAEHGEQVGTDLLGGVFTTAALGEPN